MICTLIHAITLHTSEKAELKKTRLEHTFLFLLQQRRASLGCNSQRLSSLYFSKGLLGRWILVTFLCHNLCPKHLPVLQAHFRKACVCHGPVGCAGCAGCAEPKVWYACHSPRGSKQRPFIRGHIFTWEIRMKRMKRYAKMWQAQNKTLLHLLHSLHLLHCCILRIALFKSFYPSSSQPVFESINADCVQRVHKVLLHFNGQKSHTCNACIQKIDRT